MEGYSLESTVLTVSFTRIESARLSYHNQITNTFTSGIIAACSQLIWWGRQQELVRVYLKIVCSGSVHFTSCDFHCTMNQRRVCFQGSRDLTLQLFPSNWRHLEVGIGIFCWSVSIHPGGVWSVAIFCHMKVKLIEIRNAQQLSSRSLCFCCNSNAVPNCY